MQQQQEIDDEMKTRGFANEDPMTLIKNGEFEDGSEPEIDYGNNCNI